MNYEYATAAGVLTASRKKSRVRRYPVEYTAITLRAALRRESPFGPEVAIFLNSYKLRAVLDGLDFRPENVRPPAGRARLTG